MKSESNGHASSEEIMPATSYKDITDLWKARRFLEAIDLFNQKILEDSFTGEEVAQFWGLIEAECERNPEVIFRLYQMLKESRNWDDRTLCEELRITGNALDDMKNGWDTRSEGVGLKILYQLFPQMAV